MKHTRRIASLLLALVMVFAMATTAFAADETGSITVTNTTIDQDYSIYKLFDAKVGLDADGNSTGITYTVPAGKDLPTDNTWFKVENGVVVAKDGIDSDDLKTEAFRTWAMSFGTKVGNDITSTGTNVTFTNVPYGYYYIHSTLGANISVTSTNPNASIQDKNEAPSLTKKITGATGYIDEAGENAIAQVGTNVTYTVEITVQAGAENYTFHDKMDDGLSYNKDVAVTVGESPVDATNYSTVTAAGDTLTVKFENSYISTLAADTKITITYTAKITNEALTTDSENNTAYLNYGHETDLSKTPNQITHVYGAKISVNKVDGSNQPLAGAKFKLKNTTAGDNKDKYYKWDATNKVATWVSEAEADEVEAIAITAEDGTVSSYTAEFKGLANGTYTLIETTVPAGYNKAENEDFTINGGDYTATNLVQSAEIFNQSGSTLPSTGGMGTTLFYVVGGLMVLAAVVLLVTKKRMASAE